MNFRLQSYTKKLKYANFETEKFTNNGKLSEFSFFAVFAGTEGEVTEVTEGEET